MVDNLEIKIAKYLKSKVKGMSLVVEHKFSQTEDRFEISYPERITAKKMEYTKGSLRDLNNRVTMSNIL